MAELIVGISQVIEVSEMLARPLKKPTAVNTDPFGLLSASALPAVSTTASIAAPATRPQLLIHIATLLPAPAPTPARVRAALRFPAPTAERTSCARSPPDTRSGCGRRPTSCLLAWRAPE